jgi:leucyl-tRNA synthetase
VINREYCLRVMHKKFDSEAIEKKWQNTWESEHAYDVGKRDENKEKEYILVEWPYPSGNLHIGHWYAFAVPDIYVRFRRMQGKQVLFPMGFDAFGLPAENAAIKRNLNPKNWTDDNIAYMKNQLKSMGNAFSWDKTTSSTDPEYYKWTQWMFTEFFRNNIAYRGKGIVNWCPGCNTVIANEQVLPNNTCERSGDMIEKKEMPQWMLRITQYADQLVDDLDTLDWPDHIKEAQRQWIGRSEGAEINFKTNAGDSIRIFTTRADTLFGVTYLVLAPEHPFVERHSNEITNIEAIRAYASQATQKDEQDRLDATKEKTGVVLEGITAYNPINGEAIPVYVADYVLSGYGTGAIMAVPAHDERDHAFAKLFNIEIKPVIVSNEPFPSTGEGQLMNSGEFDGLSSEEAKIRITEKVGGELKNTYRLRDWSIGRQRYWGVPIPIVYDKEGNAHPVPKEHLPWTLPTDVDFTPTGVAPLAKSQELKRRTESIFGEGWMPEVETMDTFVDSSWYFLRYIDNKNDIELSSKKSQADWMQIDTYFGGAEHTTMHLLYSRFWQKALFDLGLVIHDEPYKRRVNRGLILGPDGNKMSKSKGNVIDPDEQVKRVGADTVKMYLAFMGPYEGSNYPFNLGGIAGVRRFLERVNGLKEHIRENGVQETTKLIHKTIHKVTGDVAESKFNTAISAMMICVNYIEKDGISSGDYLLFLKMLAPFAPHITEELWHAAGHSASIHAEAYPVANPKLITDDGVTISVQVNGKMKGIIAVASNAREEEVMEQIRINPEFSGKLVGTVRKVIYIPGKVMSILTQEE